MIGPRAAARSRRPFDQRVEEISFRATEFAGQTVTVDAGYVRERMVHVPFTDEASKYIL